MSHRPLLFVARSAIALSATVLVFGTQPSAQDRLRTMPGHERFQKISAESRDAVRSGALSVTWTTATTFEYVRDGKRFTYDVKTGTATEAGAAAAEPTGR